MARPELLEVSPGWGGGKLNATSISLEPLNPAGLGSLVTNCWQSIRWTLASASGWSSGRGEALFAEETLAMLVDKEADSSSATRPG